jgi:sporulation protein YlmC with PRC-barrel domain
MRAGRRCFRALRWDNRHVQHKTGWHPPCLKSKVRQTGKVLPARQFDNKSQVKGKVMKTAKMKQTVCWLAAACMMTGAYAADTSGQSPRDSASQSPGGANQTVPAPLNDTQGVVPAKYNRASNFIGMDVRNQGDEHLGHIKDVVFDLQTGRVAYAVMTTSAKDLPGFDEKLLAVPLSVLTVSPDGKHLILNADKARVDSTIGFDKNNWPTMGNPGSVTEQFWNKGPNDQPAPQPNPMQNK